MKQEASRETPSDTDASTDIQLEEFERLVYSRQIQDAEGALLRILERARVGGEFAGHRASDETRPELYSRLASAIAALLADPAFQLSQRTFDRMALHHPTLSAIFTASAFGNSDHLLRQFGSPDPKDSSKMHFASVQNVGKLLLAYSLDSNIELDFESVFRAAPRLALPAFLGMLAHPVILSPAAHRRREKLLTLGPLFEQVDLTDDMLVAMMDAYMFSSYATREDKHDIKRSFNRMIKRSIERAIRVPEVPAERKIRERPTMLVPVEWFTSRHAMYRSYAPSIQQLRKRFRLVMLGCAKDMDDISKDLFDETVSFPSPQVAFSELIEHVQRIKPDIILYPSVGMAGWCIALSTVRLAPIQVASLGHPATTHSESIDYMIVEELWPGDPSCFSEIVLVQRPGSTLFMMPRETEFPKPHIREAPSVLRVAIPAMVSKLNAPFMAACRSIQSRVSRPLEFHFFPSKRGATWFQAKREVHRWIPKAVVYPYADYDQYLRNLALCDVRLSTFPFGGANSNIDSLRLAIPMVTLEGIEAHSQTDAGMMRRVGLPDWLITYSPSEYERAAVRLLENDAERVAIARQLERTDILEVFVKAQAGSPQDEFLRVMTFLYEHHEYIQATGRRYWRVADRESCP